MDANMIRPLFPEFFYESPDKTRRRQREANAAIPLPQRRPRALTLPLEKDAYTEKFESRFGGLSLLIARLPPEVRSLIWKYILADQRLHIVRANRRLLAIRCDEEDKKADLHGCRHACWGYSTNSGRVDYQSRFDLCYYTGPKAGAHCGFANMLSLLKTCRVIYSETIDILYSKNMFDFNHIDTILSLSKTVLRPRLDLIRVIRLEYHFPEPLYSFRPVSDEVDLGWIDGRNRPFDRTLWEETCHVLATLPNLKELYMHLGGEAAFAIEYPIMRLFEPLLQIRQPKVFDVSVTWAKDPSDVYFIIDKPFRLLTRERE